MSHNVRLFSRMVLTCLEISIFIFPAQVSLMSLFELSQVASHVFQLSKLLHSLDKAKNTWSC